MIRLPQPLTLAIYAGALFLSASIMFALQPMVGKMLLPLVGGTPAGWVTTLAFFQLALLGGYFVAYALARFPARIHAILYIMAMGLGCLFLPVHIPSSDLSNAGPVEIFRLLAVAVAVPFIALSATSSTLQRLFGTTGHKFAADPYFLYAASNLGSFAGLLLYPFFIEAQWGLADQAQYWFIGFAALIGIAALCAAMAGPETAANTPAATTPVTAAQRRDWILLAFFPSALLSAVTTHISTDVFSAPLIWIFPLAIYLLTFVLAFGKKQLFRFNDLARWHRLAVPLAMALTCVYNLNIRVSVYAMACHLFAFGVVALTIHTLLAQRRPAGNGRQLTEYYLMMAIGGAAGGLLNAFVFPFVLDRLLEYPALLALSCIMLPGFRVPMNLQDKMFAGLFAFCTFMFFLFVMSNGSFLRADSVGQLNQSMMTADIILMTLAVLLGMNIRLACFGTLALLLVCEFVIPRDIVTTARNFYGVIKVFDRPQVIGGRERVVRFMYHGTTTHGIQILGPEYERMTTAYFWGGGPVGDIFAVYNPKNVAVVGLGAGTMNCYSRPDNAFTFFEIDDAVLKIAQEQFTFLSACKASRPPKIILGDGRIELGRQDDKYNLIALDAFSSDTIPAHLLTMEAVKTYLSRLAPGGMLIFNLSNRYFQLANPLMRVAQELNLKTRFVLDVPSPDSPQGAPSIWMVLAPQGVSLSPLEDYGWVELAPPAGEQLWTDDFTNLLSSLSFHPALAPPREPVKEQR